MDINNISEERRDIGLRLNATETAIYLGKQSIGAILAVEPIDEVALANERASIHQARLARNQLRAQLEQVKIAERPLLNYTW